MPVRRDLLLDDHLRSALKRECIDMNKRHDAVKRVLYFDVHGAAGRIIGTPGGRGGEPRRIEGSSIL